MMDVRAFSRRPSGGFTLVELLIVVAIIGVIASILIPSLIDSVLRAKQKSTMSDIRQTGTGWLSWLTDQVGAMAAGQQVSPQTFDWSDFETLSADTLEATLVPQYASIVPQFDRFGGLMEYGTTGSPDSTLPIAIRAPGADEEFSGDEYVKGPYLQTEFENDLVWAGGYFIRWPSGVSGLGGG